MKSLNKPAVKKFAFPLETELKKLLKGIEELNYQRINIDLYPNATSTEKAKYNLCKTILWQTNQFEKFQFYLV